MSVLLRALALIARWGTQAFAASIVVGLLVPPLAAWLRPALPWTVFGFLTVMFARVDLATLRVTLRRPGLVALLCAWLVAVPPLLALTLLWVLGRLGLDRDIVLGVALQAAGPPLSSTPGIAILLGIEPALVLAAVLATTAGTALTAPFIADLVAGTAVPLDISSLVGRLGLLIGVAIACAAAIRLAVGHAALVRNAPALDGVGVCLYVIFGVAAMDGLVAATWRDPARSAICLGISVLLSGVSFLACWIVLRRLPASQRLIVGYATGQRNMSVLIGSLGAATPDATFLYFALAQLPIFLLPQLVRPLARRADARR